MASRLDCGSVTQAGISGVSTALVHMKQGGLDGFFSLIADTDLCPAVRCCKFEDPGSGKHTFVQSAGKLKIDMGVPRPKNALAAMA